MSTAKLYTLSAPSGAGKTSLVKALTDADTALKVSVSHTTRAPRPGETNGVNYHFVDTATFEQMINAGEFLEYAKVFDNYYGTSASWVNQQLAQGEDVILEIDWQGAAQIKALQPDAISIFILPPSIEVLEQRLINRGQDTASIIAKRLAEAKHEIAHAGSAEHIVVNDDFDTALAALKHIFQQYR